LSQHIFANQPVVFDDKDRLVSAFDVATETASGTSDTPVPGGRYILIVVP